MLKYIIIVSLSLIAVQVRAEDGPFKDADQVKDSVEEYIYMKNLEQQLAISENENKYLKEIVNDRELTNRRYEKQTKVVNNSIQEYKLRTRNLEQKVVEHQIKNGISEHLARDMSNTIQDQRDLIKNLEQQLVEIKIQIGIYEETIRNKDTLLTEQITRTANFEETLNNNLLEKINNISDLQSQMMQHIGVPSNCSNEYLTTSNYETETKTLYKTIEEQNSNIKDLQQQLEELRIKNAVNEETVKSKDLLLRQARDATNNFREEIDVLNDRIISKINNISAMHTQVKELAVPSSCIGKLTDIHNIKVPGLDVFPVPCDSSLVGSGWTVVQRRLDGSVNFTRNWTEYVEGFGNLRTEFWIGLEKLHQMTKSQPHELYVYLMDFKNEARYARYSEFLIGNKDELYKIKTIGKFTGSAGDSLEYHKNMKFSTPDRDNDKWSGHCAKARQSGWWFNACFSCNLNAEYITVDTDKDMFGFTWDKWQLKTLKFTQMMIRPRNN